MSEFPRDAACRGMDTEIFFPLGVPGSPGYERHAVLARALCAYCPVRIPCGLLALNEGLDDGIFGGLDPAQRRAIRRPLRRAA